MKLRFLILLAVGAIIFTGCSQAAEENKTSQVVPPAKAAVHQAPSQEELPEDLEESPEVKLAKCLTEKGVKLYTASWCGHCKHQKESFKDGLEYLNNIECAAFGGWSKECTDAGVKAVPAWIFADGSMKTGDTPLSVLAEENGCTY